MLGLNDYLKAGSTVVSNLLIKYYKKIGLSEEELVLYFQLLMYHSKGSLFPNMEDIATNMGLKVGEVYQILQSLLEKKIITMETAKDEQGKKADVFNLSPVFQRIEQVILGETMQNEQAVYQNSVETLYQSFEQEFGRMLSPIERETIGYWLEDDKYAVELIQLALKEAVLNQAYNLKYIDRVLLSWEKKNIRSKPQALQEMNKRKQSLSENEKNQFDKEKPRIPHVPLYNWLDSDE